MFRIILLLCLSLVINANVFAYIDPSSGLPFLSSGPFIVGLILGFLGALLLFIKKFFRFFRKHFLIILLILIAGGIMAGLIFRNNSKIYPEKIVIIGMDGLDYKLMKTFIDKGKLPHFRELDKNGTFSSLQTVYPAESDVVWTSFATGENPGNHGIFDFIMRRPSDYMPYLSLSHISKEKHYFKIGPFRIPLMKVVINKTRKAKAFWEITSKYKIPTYVYFCPGSFPPDKVYGKLISGMGVPDIRGTMGTFSFYTTKPLKKGKYTGGLVFNVERRGNTIDAFLYGPKNTLRNPPQDIKVPFKIVINKEAKEAVIYIQRNKIILKKGEWSKWVKLTFKMGLFNRIRGICRFYLKDVYPDVELYCSPINFDPRNPVFPISYPKRFSKELSKKGGLFYTQGMPYDTWALNEGRTDFDIFLQQANFVLARKEKILKDELSAFKGGVFFFYFEYSDSIQHMFWHFKNMPDSAYKNVVLECYRRMDNILGWVMNHIDNDTTLIVLSDHGFGEFNRAVNINSWLRDNGFLYLKDNRQDSKDFFEDVDWSRTKAYAIGFGGIYVNQAGREAEGIVLPGEETEKVKKDIIERLSKWHDPKTGDLVVHKVYTKKEVFSGKFNQDSPDLFAGFNIGYRASWQTALGAVPKDSISDNVKPWHADHMFDASLVPGILFINRKVSFKDSPRIIDVIPTILNKLGIKNEEKFDGENVW